LSSTQNSQKPFKGRISKVVKYDVGPGVSSKFETNLGYIFLCTFEGHDEFDGLRGHTSLVVSYDEETGEVETLNSRYQVVLE